MVTSSVGGGPGAASLQSSLISLPAHLQSDSELTAHLASRFHASAPTATLSSHALISINTYTSSSKGIDGGKDGSALAGAEELADRAWLRLGHRSENQTILFLGESGSGKSTIRSHLLTAILNKSPSLLSTKVSLAAYVFDTLTTTKTATTPTASKAGLFYELQYDTSSSNQPVLIGSKLLDHRLERSRIADVPTGERNFHVLYYLLAGTSAAEKAHLGLESPPGGLKRWKYLGHPSQLKIGINDAEGFLVFKNALRKLEFPRSEVAELCQVLAAILHIGQLEFETSTNTSAHGDESGGFSHDGGSATTVATNKDVLTIIAAFLGVNASELQSTLGYKTKMIHKERVTVMLDPAGARAHANEFARTLYSLVVAYVIESMNQRLCATEESVSSTLSVVDFPGFAQQASTNSALDQLLNNSAAESLYNLMLQNFFDRKAEMLESEDVAVPATSYFDNSDAVKGLLKSGNGLLSILDDQTRRNRTDMQLLESLRKRFEGKNPAFSISSSTARLPGSNFMSENKTAAFTVKHFAGEVEYPIRGLIEENGEIVSADLLCMLNSTKSDFVARLVGQDVLQTTSHPVERNSVMQATLSSKPMRQPSVMSKKGGRAVRTAPDLRRQQREEAANLEQADDGELKGSLKGHTEQGASGQFLSSLDNVTRAVSAPNSNTYFVYCFKSNDRRVANQFDSKCVRTQLQTFGIAEITQRLRSADISVFLPFAEFLGLTETENLLVSNERDRVDMVVEDRHWPPNEVLVGISGVFLSERCWMEVAQLGDRLPSSYRPPSSLDGLTPHIGTMFANSKERLNLSSGAPSPMSLEKTRSTGFGHIDDSRSEAGGSAFGAGDMFKNLNTVEQMAERGNQKDLQEVDAFKDSPNRKRWVYFVFLLTWLVPDAMIRRLGKMPRKDVRQAWREKLALNMLIWTSILIAAFFIIPFPLIICPKQNVFSAAELASNNGQDGAAAYVSIRGNVFDLGAFAPLHYPQFIGTKPLMQYAGLDVSTLFPVQVSALCAGKAGTINDRVTLGYENSNVTGIPTLVNSQDANARFHDFRAFRNDSRRDWYFEQMEVLKSQFLVGRVGFTSQYLTTLANQNQRNVAIIHSRVYDLSVYVEGGLPMPVTESGVPPPKDSTLVNFMDDSVVQLFKLQAGTDVSALWDRLQIDQGDKSRMLVCLDNLFYVGDVDTRNSAQCQLANWLVLAVSIMLTTVIAFKFFAALQFGTKNVPENIDKFILCQIPTYTEDEDSLRRAIDSAARMQYDDKHKLLVIICDGMIVGQGNDRPTPRIVLDILGVSESVDPEPLSFESLGEGLKQHNMGKVYAGLYEVQGHIVPFVVIAKVGKPSEVVRPGNRGKRDSQMLLMRFLNRVHYNLPMSPLELEMYHQIRNVIGVNPAFYEFMLGIDADTVVAADSATRMVSAFLDDTRLIAVCGETALTNANASFVTMIQVYEYYISHNLHKAFESLFGSVTCLPGCFSMYRIRAAETGKPLFVSREIVEAYSTIRVDTLHMKNLLHLGEDRFLTTLLLKIHNKYRTKYIFRAHAWTVVPDSWQVFLSQRRRWINSTVHNLIELIPMAQLCGFCCFSMRFVVFVDLLSTVIQPVTVAYITYLIVLLVTKTSAVPLTAFILLGAVYGMQAIIFILRRKWDMIGWMILYLLAIPVFSFGLPLYAFWHMDDFNWGNTRVVAGEKGTKIVITDEGKFDQASIPRKKWEEYQQELLEETQTSRGDDARSEISGYSYGTKAPGMGIGPTPISGFRPMSEFGAGMGYGHSNNPYAAMPLTASASTLRLDSRNLSRMSLAASEAAVPMLMQTPPAPPPHGINPRASQFFGSQFPGDDGLPSDDAILAATRDILRSADLMTVTKKSIKQELERRFGMPLDAKRAYISSATEALLTDEL